LDVTVDDDKEHRVFHGLPAYLTNGVARQKLCHENHDGEKRYTLSVDAAARGLRRCPLRREAFVVFLAAQGMTGRARVARVIESGGGWTPS
jgi:hypothetical protein